MNSLFKILRAPGTRHGIACAAPTQVVISTDEEKGPSASTENVTTYTLTAKPGLLDRWLDRVVELSGSEPIYFAILLALLTWAFLGIRFGHSNTWQITISDAQAIINMVYDAFLMRQQLNSHTSLITVAACLRSRTTSHKRMLTQLIRSGKFTKVNSREFHSLQQNDFATELPVENWLGKISTGISAFMGHIATVFGFWVGVFIWLGFGMHCQWSNTWQLYINSATSALMVLILAFLANIRERHTRYMTLCLRSIWAVDSALELRLRTLTNDSIPNPTIQIPHPKRSRIQHGIDYYADLVGTLVGIAILAFVILVWVVVGPALKFDANWWLLIGTYAGLIGLNDGFVLRNIYTVLGDYENEQFTQVEYDDMDLLSLLGIERLEEERATDTSLTCRISIKVGDLCSHQYTVVGGAIVILGLIAGASGMRWSVTGQLLCNVPPSIIESFFTMILITGHNIGEQKRRVDLFNVYARRLKLVSYVDALAKMQLIEGAESGKLDLGNDSGEEGKKDGEVEVCDSAVEDQSLVAGGYEEV